MNSTSLRFGFWLNRRLKSVGLSDTSLLEYLKHKTRERLERTDVMLTTVAGQKLYIHTEECCVLEFLRRPFEPFAVELFTAAIKPGATVLDIGAHVGPYALIASKAVGQRGKVYAFEPARDNFDVLERNVREFGSGNIKPEQLAVAECAKHASFYIAETWGRNSLNPNPTPEIRGTVSVPCMSIDGYLGGGQVDVIKMDIEGYEPFAIKGMQRTISASESLVMISELAGACLERAGITAQELVEQLESLGFSVSVICEESKELREMSGAVLDEINSDPTWSANLYCTKRN